VQGNPNAPPPKLIVERLRWPDNLGIGTWRRCYNGQPAATLLSRNDMEKVQRLDVGGFFAVRECSNGLLIEMRCFVLGEVISDVLPEVSDTLPYVLVPAMPK
jgi:hypothetical protein